MEMSRSREMALQRAFDDRCVMGIDLVLTSNIGTRVPVNPNGTPVKPPKPTSIVRFDLPQE